MMAWAFVESADRVYQQANPDRVTSRGLSVDGTSEYLAQLASQDERVFYLPYGFSRHLDPAQGKCDSRQQYLELAEQLRPDWVVVLDADEFYCREHQQAINHLLEKTHSRYTAFRFKQRHIWQPRQGHESLAFDHEAVGAYWGVPHTRVWRWQPGTWYCGNHNVPETASGVSLSRRSKLYDGMRGTPYCVHLGFASVVNGRAAKHRYYVARGEGAADGRQLYVDCRAAFESWHEGQQELPHGGRVISYDGLIPECFRGADNKDAA